VLRKISGHEWEAVEDCITRRYINLCVVRSAYKMLGRDHSEYPGADGRIILEWILRKWGGEFLE
jgi:hypothetical protein